MNRKHLIQLDIVLNAIFLKYTRIFLFIILVALISMEILHGTNPRMLLGVTLLLLILEIYLRTKVAHTYPTQTIKTSTDMYGVASHRMLKAYAMGHDGFSLMRRLLPEPEVQFLLRKAQISVKEIQIIQIEREKVVSYALQLVEKRKGTHVTCADVVTAYLLQTESTTKVLFSKELQTDDMISILSWTLQSNPMEELSGTRFSSYQGDGIGELLVYGWTPETQKYTIDLTAIALHRYVPLIGSENEWELLLSGLQKNEDNNVLLIGDQGVGKEQLVRELAYRSLRGELSERLNHRRILEFRVGQLLAGAGDNSRLQERLQSIIAEVSHAGNVILFIPDVEHILGSASFHTDLSGALLPTLRDGSLMIITSMTAENYKKYVEGKALMDVFTTIKVDESDRDEVMHMLFEKAGEIERETDVILSYTGVIAALEFAKQYKVDSLLPGAAIHLLEDAAGTCQKRSVLTKELVLSYVHKQTHTPVGVPTAAEKQELLHLEETLHTHVIGQDNAISALSDALRRIRTGLLHEDKPISFLFLGPTGVGKTETAKALASAYFGGEEHIVRLDMSEYSSADALNRLLGAAPGEGDERGDLTEKLHDKPHSLLLLDEFEKASRDVHNLFLQVLSDGRLTDNKGRTIHLGGTMIIATSNAASEYVREQLKQGESFDTAGQHKLLESLQAEHIFTPELLNRFDSVVVFQPLTPKDAIQVVKLLLTQLANLLMHQDISLTYSDIVAEKIAKDGMDSQFGARPLRRFITDMIENQIAQKELTGIIHRGSAIKLDIIDDKIVLH